MLSLRFALSLGILRLLCRNSPSDMIASLRYQIDVLFYFEKQEKLRANFRSAIRKWMVYLVRH